MPKSNSLQSAFSVILPLESKSSGAMYLPNDSLDSKAITGHLNRPVPNWDTKRNQLNLMYLGHYQPMQKGHGWIIYGNLTSNKTLETTLGAWLEEIAPESGLSPRNFALVIHLRCLYDLSKWNPRWRICFGHFCSSSGARKHLANCSLIVQPSTPSPTARSLQLMWVFSMDWAKWGPACCLAWECETMISWCPARRLLVHCVGQAYLFIRMRMNLLHTQALMPTTFW